MIQVVSEDAFNVFRRARLFPRLLNIVVFGGLIDFQIVIVEVPSL